MAYVTRKVGTFYANWPDAAGRWRRKATTAKTKSAAQKLADDLEAKAERQRFGLEPLPDPNGGGLWTDLVNWYGREYASVQPQFRRWQSTRDVHLTTGPFVGKRVVDVTPELLESWLQGKQREGYAEQSVNSLRAAVSVIFTKARKAGKWRGPNPTCDVEKRRVPRRVYDFLRPQEVAPVLDTALDVYGPVVACAFALAIYAGLRRGEVAGLRRADVDLVQGTLTVRRSHQREGVKGNVEVVLPIHPELSPFLLVAMNASRSPFVCPGDVEKGTQMPQHYDLEDRLRRTMAAAGIGITSFIHHCRAWHCKVAPEVEDEHPRACPEHGLGHIHVAARVRPLCFHDLRRSHSSLLADAGVSLTVAQKLMRHSDPKLTERVYTVLQTETLRREVSRMRFLPRISAQAVCTRLFSAQAHLAPQAPTSIESDAGKASEREGLPASDPDRDRTCDLAFRKRSLYPTELRGRAVGSYVVPIARSSHSPSSGASEVSSVIPRARSRSTSTWPRPVAGVRTPPNEGPPGNRSPSVASASAASHTHFTVTMFPGSPRSFTRPNARRPSSPRATRSSRNQPFRRTSSDGPVPGGGNRRFTSERSGEASASCATASPAASRFAWSRLRIAMNSR